MGADLVLQRARLAGADQTLGALVIMLRKACEKSDMPKASALMGKIDAALDERIRLTSPCSRGT